MKKIVDWLFTIPFLVSFGLTLAIFEPIARIARMFGLRPMEVTMGVMQRILLFVFRIGGRIVFEVSTDQRSLSTGGRPRSALRRSFFEKTTVPYPVPSFEGRRRTSSPGNLRQQTAVTRSGMHSR